MDSFPPVHGPARDHLHELLGEPGAGAGTDDTGDTAGDDALPDPLPDLPEVVEAVTGRARDLHRLADRLSADAADEGADGTLSAVALLRAHAGAVDDLAEHLLAAGGPEAAHAGHAGHAGHAPAADAAERPGASGDTPASPADGSRGVPRSAG